MPLPESRKEASQNFEADELKTAEQFFRKRDFDAVLRHLAPQVFLYRANPRYYELLGISSLYVNDFAGAHSYLMRGLDLSPENNAIKMGLAISYLWRREEAPAIAHLLAILEKHPHHVRAKRALDVIKRAPESPEWRITISKGTLRRLYPSPPLYWERYLARGTAVAGGLAGLAIVAFGIVQFVNVLSGVRTQRDAPALVSSPEPSQTAVGISQSSIENTPKGMGAFIELCLAQGKFLYKLDTAQFDGLSKAAISSFREYRDNQARLALNKIMLSNAPNVEKEKHRSLYSYLRKPDFTNFKDNVSFQDISKETALYDGVYVRWKGRVAHVVKSDNQVRLEFFVDYETGVQAVGKVNAKLAFPVELFDGENVELIAQIRVGQADSVDEKTGLSLAPSLANESLFWIDVSSIRQIQGHS